MSSLPICLFRGFQIAYQSSFKADTKITRSAKGLLAYLLLFRHRIHQREALAGLFWSDHSQKGARSCLNSSLRRLRLDCWSDEEWRVGSEFLIFTIAMG